MKKILLSTILALLVFQGISQQSFRLHVQPGKPQLAGDGDDYTTLVITARDPEGEVITTMNGKVAVRVSAGFCEAIEVNMVDGVALVKYTSPMFGTPIKASQRMVYFLFRFMQKFIARSSGSTDATANQKLATDITIESFKEGMIPTTLIPKKEGDNFAYIVCEMNGVKGKAKIEILKATEGRNGNIVQGVYYGRDITGQSEWKLNMFPNGIGTWGELNSSESDYNTIMFSNEVFTEMNDVLGKTAGMTGFLKAYLGPSWKETQGIKDFDIVKMGMGSAYMPMPNNGVFIYVPPILFEYKGRPVPVTTGNSTSGKPDEELKTDKSGIILSQNELIGDGKSRTRAVFHYQDENGVPVSGKTISWSMAKDLKIISMQTVTDANGNAEAVLEAPVLKATGETRGENTGQIIDNYDLYKITVSYASPKRANDYTQAILTVYKTIERNMRILKPGFENTAFKVLLPQLEQFRLESSVYALTEMFNMPSVATKEILNDAVVLIERKKFDAEYFNRNYESYYRKDRKLFLTMIDDPKGCFYGISDNNGKFKINVGGQSDKKLEVEPIKAKFADVTGKRKGSLGTVLALFKDTDFTWRMTEQLLAIDKSLCSLNHTQAWYTEEKLHILGNLMANTNSSAPMVKETSEAIIDASWELLGAVAFFVNDKYKITDKLWEAKPVQSVQGYGADKIKQMIVKIGGPEIQTTLKMKMYKELYKRIFALSDKGKLKGVDYYYKGMGESVYNGMAKIFEDFLEKISNGLSEWVTNNIANPKGYITGLAIDGYYKNLQQSIGIYMATDPVRVHGVYERLQPLLKDKTTDFRSMYLDVGKKRMDMGYYKADKDLLADLSKAAVVIGTVLVTRDFATMADALDKIEKASKGLDLIMAGCNIYTEYGNYCALLSNVGFCFDLVLKSTSAGAVPVAETQGGQPSLLAAFFPSASAAGAAPASIAGLSGININELKANAGNIPFGKLATVYAGSEQFDQWIKSMSNKMFSIADKEPATVVNFMHQATEYDIQLNELVTLAAALTLDPANQILVNKWNTSVSKLGTIIPNLNVQASKVAQVATTIPDNPPIVLPEAESKFDIYEYLDNKYVIYGGSAAAVVIILLVVLLLVRKRKRSKHQDNGGSISVQPGSEMKSPVLQAPSAPIAKTPAIPELLPDSTVSTPKFCPQCGAAFKPGAKFCGKCGFKTM